MFVNLHWKIEYINFVCSPQFLFEDMLMVLQSQNTQDWVEHESLPKPVFFFFHLMYILLVLGHSKYMQLWCYNQPFKSEFNLSNQLHLGW